MYAIRSYYAASLYVNYLTAIFGLRDCGRLHPRETLLVLGAAGGVGSAAVTVAKAMGARVIAAASSDAKRAAAMSSGADATVDYSQPKCVITSYSIHYTKLYES